MNKSGIPFCISVQSVFTMQEKRDGVTVCYIYHSGFVLDWSGCMLIIDFYRDACTPESPGGLVCGKLLPQARKPVYVLSTHGHADHFNPDVLKWKQDYPQIRYVFSEDIRSQGIADAADVHFLQKGGVFSDGLVRIEACGSTDIGVSFLIEAGKTRIFHAGDLNNWHWSDESDPEEIRQAGEDFLKELDYLSSRTEHLDIAFFPVDSRMGSDYMRGARQFAERMRPAVFVPMHFGLDYAGGNAFRPLAEAFGCRFLTLSEQGESHFVNI